METGGRRGKTGPDDVAAAPARPAGPPPRAAPSAPAPPPEPAAQGQRAEPADPPPRETAGPSVARRPAVDGRPADGPAARGLRPLRYVPPEAPLRLLHADAHLVAVDKPAGLLTVPGRGEGMEDCLVARVAARFPGARAVHRLDLDTSGVVVLALTAEAHRHLGLQFERRHAAKRYLAVVAGVPDREAGRIDSPLAVDWPRRPRQRVDPAGRPAVTDWRVLARAPDAPPRGRARLALSPLTGRSHQLRVHLAKAGWPILGDPIYADEAAFAAAPRMLLHAEALTLRHPSGGAPVTYQAPAPF